MPSYSSYKNLSDDERIESAKVYLENGHTDDALTLLSSVLDDDPDHPEALFHVSQIMTDADKIGIASALLRRLVEIAPDRAEVWTALGRTIPDDTNEPEALACFRKALEIDHEYHPAMINMGAVLTHSGKPDKAIRLLTSALSIDPSSVAAHDMRGMSHLMLGNWRDGWRDNLWSLGEKFRKEVIFGDEERWDGTPGKAVIIYGEQGLGDEIMFASVLPDAIEDCKKVIIECDPKLEGLFKRSFPKAIVYGTRRLAADWPNNHKWDARCSIGTLPMYYRNSDDEFPGSAYLKADPVRRKQWRTTLDDLGERPKIGIAWNGGGKYTGRGKRHIPLEYFKPLFDIGDVICLEYEKVDFEGYPIHHWPHATLTNNYDDTAALVAELDFVVSTTTTINHLCGALGVPCHVLVEEKPNYRFYQMKWHDCLSLYRGDHTQNIKDIVNAYISGIQKSGSAEASGK